MIRTKGPRLRPQSSFILGTVTVCLAAFAGCAQAPDSPVEGSPPANAADDGLTCPQIVTEISRQNAIIKEASARAQQGGQTGLLSNPTTQTADLGNSDTGSAALVPGGQQETPGQLEADRTGTAATARAKALVTLGRDKKCFQ